MYVFIWLHQVLVAAHRIFCLHCRMWVFLVVALLLLFSRSVMSDSLRPMDSSTPGFPVHHQLPSLLKLMSIKSVMSSYHLFLCHPLLLSPSIFPSIRAFSNKSALLIKQPKYWSFSFNINPSNEYSGLISFRIEWLDLLAVQGNLKSLLQYHSSKTSILYHSAFFVTFALLHSVLQGQICLLLQVFLNFLLLHSSPL